MSTDRPEGMSEFHCTSNSFFTPIGPAPPMMSYTHATVRPIPTNPELMPGQTFAQSTNGLQTFSARQPFAKPNFQNLSTESLPRAPGQPAPPSEALLTPLGSPAQGVTPTLGSPPSGSPFFGSPPGRSQKRKPANLGRANCFDGIGEPEPKVHLTDDYVAQTMSELYISNPKPKVAKRDFNRDVSETMNLESLNDLESRFSNQAINEDFCLPPVRSRKLPNRNRPPQLRLTLHKDLKNVRTANVIPDSLISRYRPSPKQVGSTALVLWQPPGGIVPSVISSGRSRTRCFSEVTTTPFSSQENLVEGPACHMVGGRTSPENLSMSNSPVSAEAPELSSNQEDMPVGVNLQRRNSAPEMSEPLPFLDDDGSMEL